MRKSYPFSKRLGIFLLGFFVAVVLYVAYDKIEEQYNFYQVTAAHTDITQVLQKATLTDADYALLFEQTGIAAPMVDILKAAPDFEEKMLVFQQNYLRQATVTCSKMNWLTKMDIETNSDGLWIPSFQIAPVEKGYVLLTKATHTLNYRHGHAGIVVDAVRGKTLESLEPFSLSMEQDVAKWAYYPTFKMMRLKEDTQNLSAQIADYAYTSLIDLPYNILGMKYQGKNISSTHCSLLVWQAFKKFGIDVDGDGGIFVSPSDIAKSPYLETLQIYGFDPQKDW